ncbi:MAG: hypothetical protein AAF423_03485 [Pseudomonadota bacterium]
MEIGELTLRQRLVLYAVGYIFAVLIAVSVAVVLAILPTVFPDNGKWGSFYKEVEFLHLIIFLGISYTGMTALPGYALTLVLARRMDLHSAGFYIAAGVLTALLAHLILASFAGGFFLNGLKIFYTSFPGGAAGAYGYFLWRKKMLSVWNVRKNSRI